MRARPIFWYWRAFAIGLLGFAVLGAITLLFAPDYIGAYLCGLYCIPANSVFPIPHEPVVLYFAKSYDPWLIATAATLGSVVMSFADYALVESVLYRSRVGARTRQSRMFRWAVRWMKRWPFAVVVVFSFVPLPITIVRILAPASGYPIGRYIAAQIIGRFPRFLLLGALGKFLQVPTWLLVGVLVVLIASFLIPSSKKYDDEDVTAL